MSSTFLQVDPINASALGDNTLVAAVAGKQIHVHKIWYVVAADVNTILKHGSTNFHPVVSMKASGSLVLDFDEHPWFVTAAGEDFILNLSAAVQVSGMVYYRTQDK